MEKKTFGLFALLLILFVSQKWESHKWKEECVSHKAIGTRGHASVTTIVLLFAATKASLAVTALAGAVGVSALGYAS
ncbi:hypothetical protein P3L10_033254 [Capsicum annuum]